MAAVAFYNGTTLIGPATLGSGTAANGSWSLPWNNIAPGSYTLTAKATDNQGAAVTSAAVSFTVMASQLPGVSITAPTATQTFAASGSPVGADVMLTASDK